MTPHLVPREHYLALAPHGAALVRDRARFARLCALLRIDALACLMAARHGWLGAGFSCVEILAAIHHLHIPDPREPLASRPRLLLSKGHAAAAHYAVLAALGAFPPERLLSYKDDGGLPAHVERGVPGVDAGSGSLGQGLSKAVGMTLSARAAGMRHPAFVILGDGELQEGQVFESLLSLASKGLSEVVVVIDRNGLQTDSSTRDIKEPADWAALLAAIGLEVVLCDGHDGPALAEALTIPSVGERPRVVLARTFKGYGTALTAMRSDAPRRTAVWHGRIPDEAEYADMLRELAAAAGFPELAVRHAPRPGDDAKRGPGPAAPAGCGAEPRHLLPVPLEAGRPCSPAIPATADAFGETLIALAERFPNLHALDADLEKSCRLTAFADRFPKRFHEMGISEQDMVSTACGIGTSGGIALAATYAAFHRRSLDQAFCACLDGAAVILAGHYAGLDYHTDGRTHQSLHDVALFRAPGSFDVVEPLTAAETGWFLEARIAEFDRRIRAGLPCRPVYLRLHRSAPHRAVDLPGGKFAGVYAFRSGDSPAADVLVAASPHFLAVALDLQAALAAEGLAVDVVGVSSYDAEGMRLSRALHGAKRLFALESHAVLGGLACLIAERTGLSPYRFGAGEPAGCTRSHETALAAHGLTHDLILATIRGLMRDEIF